LVRDEGQAAAEIMSLDAEGLIARVEVHYRDGERPPLTGEEQADVA
jgi:hypothetical protein